MTRKRLISGLVALLCVAALALPAGCKSSSTSATASKAGNVNAADVYGSSNLSAETIEALQNSGEITLYTDNADLVNSKFSDDWKEAFDWYETYYGLKIHYKYQAYGDDLSKFLVDFAAGDAPDIIGLNYRRWPKAGNRQLVYNMDELKDKGVLGLDHPDILKYADMNKRFSINDKCYSVSISYVSPVVVGVNTDLFDRFQVKSPVEYYKEGTWDFDSYIKCCADLSRTLSDGSKIFATGCWNHSWWLVANDCCLVDFDKNDKLVCHLTDPKVLEMLQFIKDYGIKGYQPTYEQGGYDWFVQGKQGMCVYTANNLSNLLKDTTFKWDFVPMPLGPDNTSGLIPGEVTGVGVVTSSKNLQGCVNYVIADLTFNNHKTGRSESRYYIRETYDLYSDEQVDMIINYASHVSQDLFMGVGGLNSKQHNFWNALTKDGDNTVKEVVDTYEGMFLEEVRAENDLGKRD